VLGEAGLQILGVQIRAERIIRDPVLGWRNRPGWRGPTYTINSWGCLGPEPAAPKPAGVTRILCLGDSCTAGDLLPRFEDTYPSQLSTELRRLSPDRETEVINAAVGGYSSFQGRLWLERELLDLEPDVLVVYFGWNDHWPARAGGSDEELSGSLHERLRAWLAWSKVVQLAIRTYHMAFGRRVVPAGEGAPTAVSGRPPRVSRTDYRANLLRMAEVMAERGGKSVFVTAPNYLALTDAPQEVFADRATAEAVVRVHESYCNVARKAAADAEAFLVDAARAFEQEAAPDKLFWRPEPSAPLDFIHLSPLGYHRLATLVAHSGAFGEAKGTP
jgi:lysophospholipase L1-like esterase